MNEWGKKRIGDFANVISGFAFKSSDFQDNGIPIIKIKNIRIGNVNLLDVEYVNSSFLSLDEKYHVKGGDILISLTGSHLTQPNSVVGRVAILSHGNGHCLLNQRAGKIIIKKPEDCKSAYLFYVLFTKELRRTIALMASGAASQANVSPKQVESVEIPLPPLPTQHKIAAILSAYDDLIENNTRRIRILEDMAQALYREWFIDFRFPGHENVKMVESELGMVPEGWGMKVLGELLKHYIGGGWGKEKEDNKNSLEAYVIRGTDIPLTRYASIENCPLRFHKESNLKSRRLEDKDIVFEVSGGSKGQPVGRALLISQKLLDAFNKDVICASFCKLLRINNEIIISEIIYLHLLEIYKNGNIGKYQTQSTGIINFKFSYFIENESIMIPEKDLQIKFDKIISPIFNMIQSFGLKNANLRRTRDLLLPKLISGEVDVSTLDITIGEAT